MSGDAGREQRGAARPAPVGRDGGAPALEPPTPGDALPSLGLPRLRAHRQALTAEEDRVSYWRRIVHARIDVLQAEARAGEGLSFEQLVRALGDTATGGHRQALAGVTPADVLPQLPDLESLWAVRPDVHDAAGVAEAVERLRDLEARLTAYRRALHARLDEVTAHLIERYRQDPRAALDLIPTSGSR